MERPEWDLPSAKPAETPGRPTHPLDGIRVLELANYIAGPYCGMVLADFGADVIKVENPRGGDFSRLTSPFVEGESAGFMALNRNKKSIALDLKAPRGREIFLDLVRTADVLVENFRPGTMADLGVDYPVLAEINPRLIYSAATGFGQTGPYSQRAALDLIVQGMSGLMAITGEPGRPPVKVGVPVADLAAALFGASAILAALYIRRETGEGQQIDVTSSNLLLRSRPGRRAASSRRVRYPSGSARRIASAHRIRRSALPTAISPSARRRRATGRLSARRWALSRWKTTSGSPCWPRVALAMRSSRVSSRSGRRPSRATTGIGCSRRPVCHVACSTRSTR